MYNPQDSFTNLTENHYDSIHELNIPIKLLSNMPKSVYNIKRAFVELMYSCDCDEITTAESRHDQNSMD